jgi:integrase
MGKVKVERLRGDILRREEIDDLMERAESVFMPDRFRCIVALLWLFGKRINEVLSLKREDVSLDDRYLSVRFKVSKKRDQDLPVAQRYVKRIRADHPYVQYVRKYLQMVDGGTQGSNGGSGKGGYGGYGGGIQGSLVVRPRRHRKNKPNYLFPSYGRTRIIRVKRTVRGETKEYVYTKEGGHLSSMRFRQQLDQLNRRIWPHLFRHSLATYMAEAGASEEELMHWFDWEEPRTAHHYVKMGTRLTEKWSNREF